MRFAACQAAFVCLIAAWQALNPVHAATCETPAGAPRPATVSDWKPACRHVLCGTVLDMRAPSPSPLARGTCPADSWQPLLIAIASTLNKGGLVSLGEVHDNRAHHLLRAELLKGAKAVIFEQIRGDQQAALDTFADAPSEATAATAAADLMRRVDWKNSGWPEDDYRPLIEAAIAAKAKVYAGDAPRDTMMALTQGTASAVTPQDRVRLKLDEMLGAKLDDASLTEIESAHCGMVPKSAFGGMAFAQRYRDAHLADAAVKAIETQGSAVLIAGNTHVRSDRGVPWYVIRRLPGKPIVSVMLIEVEDGRTDPLSYAPRDPSGTPVADFLIFTPRIEREDPCQKFRVKKTG